MLWLLSQLRGLKSDQSLRNIGKLQGKACSPFSRSCFEHACQGGWCDKMLLRVWNGVQSTITNLNTKNKEKFTFGQFHIAGNHLFMTITTKWKLVLRSSHDLLPSSDPPEIAFYKIGCRELNFTTL